MYVMYEGDLASEAKIEVVSNRLRDTHTIALRPEHVHGIYGGAEEWVDDLSIRIIPSKGTTGTLRIGLYCGSGFSDEDSLWYSQLTRK